MLISLICIKISHIWGIYLLAFGVDSMQIATDTAGGIFPYTFPSALKHRHFMGLLKTNTESQMYDLVFYVSTYWRSHEKCYIHWAASFNPRFSWNQEVYMSISQKSQTKTLHNDVCFLTNITLYANNLILKNQLKVREFMLKLKVLKYAWILLQMSLIWTHTQMILIVIPSIF